MSKKATLAYPPLGTLIDRNSLELVDVLGIGGYGVVYRATEVFTGCQRSYAVKCLASTSGQGSIRRQLHIREISLHQLASAHPSVVTLHRVVEDMHFTYIIMDYAPDSDLFTQILHNCQYLGLDTLIKHIFIQMLDAVQYCHSLGIYHRDLKPENVLCFDRGYRVAITDFGLATTEKSSIEFETGSVYHMSPECQGRDSKNRPAYSPKHNDIWSLGIILLNLVTGRNPWKSATPDDLTYQAYKRSPSNFFPSVLPISEEFNNILVHTLDVKWKARWSLAKIRDKVLGLSNFYSDNVIFEGSLARCSWEVALDLANGAQQPHSERRPVPHIPEGVDPYCVSSDCAVASDFKSEASTYLPMWKDDPSRYNVQQSGMDLSDPEELQSYEVSGRSSDSDPSQPVTPNGVGDSSSYGVYTGFDMDSVYEEERYFDAESSIFPLDDSSMTETDDNRFASSVFLATPVGDKPYYHPSEKEDFRTQKCYSSPNTSVYAVAAEHSVFSDDSETDDFPPSSHNFVVWPKPSQPRKGSRPIDIQGRAAQQSKVKSHNMFHPMRFFPRSSGPSWLDSRISAGVSPLEIASGGYQHPTYQPSVNYTSWTDCYYPRQVPNAGQVRYGHRIQGQYYNHA